MSVTVSNYKGVPGPSWGKIEFSRQGDRVALDMDNSLQYSFSIYGGKFYVIHSLLERPGHSDWVNFNVYGTSVDSLLDSQNSLPLMLVKWVRFELREFSDVYYDSNTGLPSEVQRHPTIFFRNMNLTRIITLDAASLRVFPPRTNPRQLGRDASIDLNPGDSYSITKTHLRSAWFDGDDLTRYYASTTDDNVVDVSYALRNVTGTKQRYAGDEIESIDLSVPATAMAGQSAVITIRALDAVGNEASADMTVNIT